MRAPLSAAASSDVMNDPAMCRLASAVASSAASGPVPASSPSAS